MYVSLSPGGVRLATNVGTLGLPAHVNHPKLPDCAPFKIFDMTVPEETPDRAWLDIPRGYRAHVCANTDGEHERTRISERRRLTGKRHPTV